MNALGKLSMDVVPMHEPIIMVATIGMLGGAFALLALVTYMKWWGPLWRDWLTSVDHKRIGAMYIIVALVMMVRGFADALMMRTQLAIANGVPGPLPPEHYDQIFTAHGVIMIFFVAMPLVVGLMNVVVPLQIGARDVAFPFLNSLSFWLFGISAVLINLSLFIGDFAATGWLAYPPLSGIEFSPSVGVDYYIWALQLSGLGTLLTGVNFLVTIFRMRAPGMTLMRMPIFTWTALISNMLIVVVFPVLTVVLALLGLDRYVGTHFFTNGDGGNMMMYVNLIWIWGHPEVYILVLPAFGIFSEVISTFSRKRLFGYKSMVYATAVIGVLSFVVWLHHFFTMGSGASVNTFFGIATMIISIPTGVKVFNWLFTIYKGRLEFTTPVLWTLGFLVTFTIGGMTGVMLSVPGADFVLHNSLFLIAHFHNTIIGGAVFGYFAGFSFWFPKMFGYKLDETWGKRAFWGWIIGFYLAFMPLYILGFMGMTRRTNHYDNPAWQPYLIVALIGALCIAVGVACQVIQLIVSYRNRKQLADLTGDPWNGRTLEWSTASPPPVYNFSYLPEIRDVDALWDLKQKDGWTPRTRPAKYEAIHMPSNTPMGLILGAMSLVLGFSFVWHIWWLVIVAMVGLLGTVLWYTFHDDDGYMISPETIKKTEDALLARMGKA
ncbi:cytochrome o ubiquinol oxidase subunit I [Amphibiibacter pelophylacis]|uniref:Cytochrome o ubiquinol oxidase subunit I n=1 Tax=Amphibiibacter pelophylacis TaxID=1799477 RepID=A0ACC6P3Y7_9BURK